MLINVEHLVKEYTIKKRNNNRFAFLRSIGHRDTELVKAIDDVSFSIDQGEMVALIGPNGAGKSTIIKTLTGILYPTAGDVKVFGLNPWKNRRKLTYRMGVVFGQKSQLLFHLPLIESYKLFADIYDLNRKQYKDELELLVHLFSLEHLLDFPIRKMSLGQRMKCEIVASLLHRPELLFLDEPTIGLDILSKQQIRDALQGLNKQHGTTLMLSSHDSGDIEFVCNRAIVVNHGTIWFDDSIEAIRKKFLTRKNLKVVFAGSETPRFELPDGVELLSQQSNELVLAVDEHKIISSQLMKRLISKHDVMDFSVANPTMDEIISAVFKATNDAYDKKKQVKGYE